MTLLYILYNIHTGRPCVRKPASQYGLRYLSFARNIFYLLLFLHKSSLFRIALHVSLFLSYSILSPCNFLILFLNLLFLLLLLFILSYSSCISFQLYPNNISTFFHLYIEKLSHFFLFLFAFNPSSFFIYVLIRF
jgi:hypothetical protein